MTRLERAVRFINGSRLTFGLREATVLALLGVAIAFGAVALGLN